MKNKIIVHRGTKKSWIFEKTAEGNYECKKKHTYRLMFSEPEIKPIWIGIVTDKAITTCEKQIGATSVEFFYGYYIFIG